MTPITMRALARHRALSAFTILPAPRPTNRGHSSPSLQPKRPFSSSLRPLATTPSLSQSRPILPATTTAHHRTRPLSLPQQSRPFSVLSVVETPIAATQTLLTALHEATGIPWYLTIPLFALCVNLATRLPATAYTLAVAARRARLTPLARARAHRVVAEIHRRQRVAPTDADFQFKYRLANLHGIRSLYRRWGVEAWRDWLPGVAVFPVWVVSIEALRRMCGGPRGLLGTLAFGPKEGQQQVSARIAEVSAVAQGGGGAGGGGELAASSGQQVQEALAAAAAAAAGAEPSMATGGCLWFPDLMAADPYHILPLALSAILVLNLLPRSEAGIRRLLDWSGKDGAASNWRQRMRRALLLVAMAVGPLTMDLPAALHLYWICSATLTFIETEILKRLLPMPKIVSPATRVNNKPIMLPTREETKKR